MKSKAAGYIRVSTTDQAMHGLSLAAQRDLIQRYAKEHELDLVEIYADEGVSAAKSLEKRLGILSLVADAEQGKFSVILFKDITRWSRNAAQYYKVQERLDKCQVAWIAIEQPYLETVTPTGRFQVSVMLGTAQLEADQTGQRIKAVQEAEVRRGYYPFPPHCAPTGYTTKKIDGHNHLIIDESQRGFIENLYDTFMQTGNATKTARIYGKVASTVLETIRNPIYKGEFRGIRNFCEPIIPPEVWERANALSQHHAYTPNKHEYIFSGLPVCGYCGTTMRWNCPNDKYHMCRCVNCNGNTMTEKIMEKLVLEQIEPELNRYRITVKAKQKPKASRGSIEGKMKRLNDLYIDGMIDRAEFDKRRAEYQAALEEPPAPPSLPVSWREMYNSLSKKKKNVLWKTTIHHIVVKDKKIDISFEATKVLAERMAMTFEH